MAQIGPAQAMFMTLSSALLVLLHGMDVTSTRYADSIAAGSINRTEVPYRLVIKNYDRIGGRARQMANDFIDLIHELAAEGCPVQIRAEASDGGVQIN